MTILSPSLNLHTLGVAALLVISVGCTTDNIKESNNTQSPQTTHSNSETVNKARKPVQTEDYRIAYINATKVFDESPQYQAARNQLHSEFHTRENALLTEKKQIKQLEEKLRRNNSMMGESEIKDLEYDIQSRKRKLNNAQKAFREDLSSRQNEEYKKLRQQILEVVRVIGNAERFDLILADDVVYYNKRIDISNLVLEKLREQIGQ
jgi:outer membrane protein